MRVRAEGYPWGIKKGGASPPKSMLGKEDAQYARWKYSGGAAGGGLSPPKPIPGSEGSYGDGSGRSGEDGISDGV